jgi:hypothetical protein
MQKILKTIELSETEIQVIRIALENQLITFEGRGYVETLETLQLKFLELAQQTLPTPEHDEMLAANKAFLFR